MTTEYRPTVLFSEADDPAVSELRDNRIADDLGVDFRFEQMSLDEAVDVLNRGEVDAVVSGASHTTKDVFLAGIRKFGAVDGFASSFFMMEKEGEDPLFFADCAINVTPDPSQLAKIAAQTCESVQHLGFEPVVAFISLSTYGSAGHLDVVKNTVAAVKEFKESHPDVLAYGEIQYDAARDPRIYKKKTGKDFEGGKKPNVFIFPDGLTGNTVYKAVEIEGERIAVGPLFQGFNVEGVGWHDSSRGVTPDALAKIGVAAGKLSVARRQSHVAKSAKTG